MGHIKLDNGLHKFSSLGEKLKRNYAVIINFLFLLLLVCFSRDTLITSTRWNFYVVSIGLTFVCYSYFFLYLLSCQLKVKIGKDSVIIAGLIALCVFLTMIVNQKFELMDFYFLMVVSIALLFCLTVDFSTFCRSFVAVMVFLCVYSIICTYLLRGIWFSPNSHFPIIFNSSKIPFYDFGFAFVVANKTYLRNFGVFREPGVYQVFINIALIIELFVIRSKRGWVKVAVVAVLGFTVLTTFSISGCVTAFIVMVTYIIARISRSTHKIRAVIIVSAVGFACVGLVAVLYAKNNNFHWELVSAFNKIVHSNDSLSARMGSIVGNLQSWVQAPLFGRGPDTVLHLVKHNTSTTSGIFAIYGTLVGLVHLLLFFGFAYRVDRRLWVRIVLFVALMLSINNEMLFTNQFLWVLSFSFFMRNNSDDSDKLFRWIQSIIKNIRKPGARISADTLDQ